MYGGLPPFLYLGHSLAQAPRHPLNQFM